mgnify:CR=1 FL=1
MSLRKLIAAAVMAGTAACGLAATSQAGEFDGVTATQIVGQILLDVPMPQENGAA